MSIASPAVPARPTGRREIATEDRLAGCAPAELAERFGTPVYVYDLDVIERQVTALQAVVPARVDLAYAVKANPALAVVAFLGGRGLGADVASAGELALAARAGIPAERVVMTGPGKRADELSAAVQAGIRAVTVESPGELDRLERIASEAARRVPVMLRAAATGDAAAERVRLVGDGGAGKFGMDGADLRRAARRAAESPHLELLGLHAFGASNVLEARALVAHARATTEVARNLAAEAALPIRLIDIGGGLGIPYGPDDVALDLTAFGDGLARLIDGWPADPLLRAARLVLEPGRFLVGPAGAYLARVVDTKVVEGALLAILDGGVHHVLRPALVGQEHRLRIFTQRPDPASERLTVAGPLCSGLDILARDALLPVPEPGDLVAVLDVGAYGYTESMPLFLSHPIPAEVAVRGGRAELIRPRVEPSTWIDTQLLPDW